MSESSGKKIFPTKMKWVQYVIVFTVIVVPIFYIRAISPYAAPKSLLIIAMGIIILGLLISLWISNRSYIPKLPKIYIIIGLFIIWATITAFTGLNPAYSFWSSFYRGDGIIALTATIIFSIGLLNVLQYKDIKILLAKSILWAGVLLNISIWVSNLFPENGFIFGTKGLIGNTSYAGIYLIFPIFAAIFLMMNKAVKNKWPIIALIFILLSPIYINLSPENFSLGSLLGEARAGVISILLGLLAWLVLWMSYSPKKIIRNIANTLAIIGAIGIVYITVLFFTPGSIIQNKFIEAASPTRYLYGEMSEISIKENPLLGVGWSNFIYVHSKFFDPKNITTEYLSESFVDHPHNFILQVAVSTGIPGLILYLLILGIIFFNCSSYIRKEFVDRKIGALFFGLFIAYFFQLLWLFELAITQLMFYISIAWLLSYGINKNREDNSPLIKKAGIRKTINIIIIIVVIFGIYQISIKPITEMKAMYRLTTKTLNINNITPPEEVFSKSHMGTTLDETKFIDLIINKYFENWDIVQDHPESEKVMELVSKEIEVYLNYFENSLEKIDTPFIRTYIVTSNLNNAMYLYSKKDKDSERFLKRAEELGYESINISPHRQHGYWSLAKTYSLENKVDKSIKFANMAIGMAPTTIESHIVLIGVLSSANLTDEAIQAFERAKSLIPKIQKRLDAQKNYRK